MNARRKFIKAFGACGAAAFAPACITRAWAQQFPSRPVHVITPFPPGSGPDAALRVLAETLAARWGQPVVVDNKPGGNGFIAVSAFRQATADGHELIQLDSTHTTTHPHTFSKLPYDVERDFVPLAMMLRTSFFVVTGAGSPYKSLDDIVAAARSRPGGVTYGSWFTGSPGHLGGLQLEAMKSLHMVHVPFRDFGQLYAAVASQQIDWALGSIASAGALERGGKIRFIAFAAPVRDPQYPNVPATGEMPDFRGFEVSGWAGLFGPRGLAPALRNQISADVAASLADPGMMERYRAFGYEAPKLDPDEFAQLIRRETAAWGEIVRTANLRLD
jgi:tripartite-type tricarboxylate transporter receptor subunit TctC